MDKAPTTPSGDITMDIGEMILNLSGVFIFKNSSNKCIFNDGGSLTFSMHEAMRNQYFSFYVL